MSKYSFDQMHAKSFENMVQALLEKKLRMTGNLIQFGEGKDGGREATWQQPPAALDYRRPANEQTDVPKEWVFQVKHHDVAQRGWATARDTVVTDLANELHKIVKKHKVPCHAYVLATNVPFTGARFVGTHNKIASVVKEWTHAIPEIYVWDAADLSRLLDDNADVRTAYIETILTGDVLREIYNAVRLPHESRQQIFKSYLLHVADQENSAGILKKPEMMTR